MVALYVCVYGFFILLRSIRHYVITEFLAKCDELLLLMNSLRDQYVEHFIFLARRYMGRPYVYMKAYPFL